MSDKLEPGTVVVVMYFPHQEDRTKGEPRWVIVTEDLQDKLEIVPMTSQTDQLNRYPKGFIISDKSAEGKLMGLEGPSLFMPERKVIKDKIAFSKGMVKGKCSDDFLDNLIALL